MSFLIFNTLIRISSDIDDNILFLSTSGNEKMCNEDGYRFLNTSEVLKSDNGFGVSGYFAVGDIHFNKTGLNALLEYVKTHALNTEQTNKWNTGDSVLAEYAQYADEVFCVRRPRDLLNFIDAI